MGERSKPPRSGGYLLWASVHKGQGLGLCPDSFPRLMCILAKRGGRLTIATVLIAFDSTFSNGSFIVDYIAIWTTYSYWYVGGA